MTKIEMLDVIANNIGGTVQRPDLNNDILYPKIYLPKDLFPQGTYIFCFDGYGVKSDQYCISFGGLEGIYQRAVHSFHFNGFDYDLPNKMVLTFSENNIDRVLKRIKKGLETFKVFCDAYQKKCEELNRDYLEKEKVFEAVGHRNNINHVENNGIDSINVVYNIGDGNTMDAHFSVNGVNVSIRRLDLTAEQAKTLLDMLINR